MKNLPMAIIFPQFSYIAAYDNDGEQKVDVFIGDIAEQYLRKFASVSVSDKTFDCKITMVSFTLGTRKHK